MFDNPEKLFILFVIALLIFGPSKLATLGASLGRSIRDFRGAVRGAHDEFRAAVQEHIDTVTTAAEGLAPALPAPDGLMGMADVPAVDYTTAMSTPATPDAEMASHDTASTYDAAPAGEEDLSSLASEPTAAALKETLSRT